MHISFWNVKPIPIQIVKYQDHYQYDTHTITNTYIDHIYETRPDLKNHHRTFGNTKEQILDKIQPKPSTQQG